MISVMTARAMKIGSRTERVTRHGGHDGRKDKTMFKKFIQRIIDAKDREDAYSNVFYGDDGIDVAYQRGKITWNEHEMLADLIDKLPKRRV